MAKIADILAKKSTVELRGERVEVRGVSMKRLGEIAERFPSLLDGLGGDPSAGSIAAVGSAAVCALIAAGIGTEDAEDEAALADLGIGEQAELLDAVLAATLPKGQADFWKTLGKLAAQLGVERTKAAALVAVFRGRMTAAIDSAVAEVSSEV